jgi:hypothetical protein
MTGVISTEAVAGRIYAIRGRKVMLDRDLAELYGVETRALNQAVKRNVKRFPDDFMFQLTRFELDNLMSQIVTSSWGGVRKLLLAFTEQGVAMLSSVLNSERAIEVNIQIIRTFMQLRQMAIGHRELRRKAARQRLVPHLPGGGRDAAFVRKDRKGAARPARHLHCLQ